MTPFLILSILYGSTNKAASPAISFIGSKSEVNTTLPTACPSIIGIPKPSYNEGKETMSQFIYSSNIS